MVNWLPLALFGGLLLGLAIFFGSARNLPRQRLRRSFILYPAFAAAVVAHYFARRYQVTHQLPEEYFSVQWLKVLALVGEVLGVLLLINLAALIIFDLVLRVLRLRTPDILHDLSVGAAYLIAGVWLMHRAGVNLASIVATSAVVTAVIGLSLQSTLGSVIGGLALQVDDSINEGDWIELENKVQGQVKKIRWRHTVIETRDWDTLVVPNNLLLNQTIKLLGKREGQPLQHRMWVYFNVDFRFSPGEVIRCVDAALQGAPIPGVAAEPKAHVICFDLAKDHRDSFVYYAARYWLTDIARDDPTSSAVRERIVSALQRAQIPLALPAVTLFMEQETQEYRERKQSQRLASALRALSGVELFTSLSADELRALAERSKVAPFARGEIITRQGAKAHWLYVLTSGQAEVKVTKGGTEKHVASLEAPGFFGEMALMTGAAREATVVATTDVVCLRVDREDFSALIKNRPEIASEISTILATRRVALQAVLEGIESSANGDTVQRERNRILASIREFFALNS